MKNLLKTICGAICTITILAPFAAAYLYLYERDVKRIDASEIDKEEAFHKSLGYMVERTNIDGQIRLIVTVPKRTNEDHLFKYDQIAGEWTNHSGNQSHKSNWSSKKDGNTP